MIFIHIQKITQIKEHIPWLTFIFLAQMQFVIFLVKNSKSLDIVTNRAILKAKYIQEQGSLNIVETLHLMKIAYQLVICKGTTFNANADTSVIEKQNVLATLVPHYRSNSVANRGAKYMPRNILHVIRDCKQVNSRQYPFSHNGQNSATNSCGHTNSTHIILAEHPVCISIILWKTPLSPKR